MADGDGWRERVARLWPLPPLSPLVWFVSFIALSLIERTTDEGWLGTTSLAAMALITAMYVMPQPSEAGPDPTDTSSG